MGLPWYRVHTVVLNDPGRLIAVGRTYNFSNINFIYLKNIKIYKVLGILK